MADNVPVTPGAGATIATDDVGGIQFQKVKLDVGSDGVSAPLSPANPMPVSDADLLALLGARLAALTSTIPDNQVLAAPARLVGQDITACSFTDVGASLVTPDMTQLALGSNHTVAQTAGSLVVTTGTDANSEWLARSVRSWRGSLLARVRFTSTQRIANQNFAVMLADKIGEGLTCTINGATDITVALPGHAFTAANVGQSMMIGAISGAAGVPGRWPISAVVPGVSVSFTVAGWPGSGSCTVSLFGWSYCRNLYTNATSTNSLFDTQRKGWNNGDTTATVTTTNSPGHIAQMHLDGRDAYLADTLSASSTTPNVTHRASKIENLPDDNLDLYLYLWSYNGTSAPATTTTWTIGFWSVEKFANLPVYLQGNRMQGTAAPLPVLLNSNAPINDAQTNGQTTVTAANGIKVVGLAGPINNADMVSGAKTTSGNSGTITPGNQAGETFHIGVSSVSGTTPTLDLSLEESHDDGTTWYASYQWPRLTAAAVIQTEALRLNGTRYRWVWTISGTTPSFTLIINAKRLTWVPPVVKQFYDRSINPNTLSSTTPTYRVDGCSKFKLTVNMGAITTTAPAFQLQVSDDATNWVNVGTPITSVASSTVVQTIADLPTLYIRAIETTAGVAATLGFISIRGMP